MRFNILVLWASIGSTRAGTRTAYKVRLVAKYGDEKFVFVLLVGLGICTNQAIHLG